jgi:hypothetical protein
MKVVDKEQLMERDMTLLLFSFSNQSVTMLLYERI